MSGHLHTDDTEPVSAESDEQPGFAKRTRQRRAVTRVLADQPGFVSAQVLHARLEATGHRVGLSTVYRTLHAMAEAGSADTVRGESGEELFRRRRTPGHHHYLVCRRCGYDVPVGSPTIEDWADHVAVGHGFSQVHHTIELVGLCADCTRDTA